jgi:hypothetical protein
MKLTVKPSHRPRMLPFGKDCRSDSLVSEDYLYMQCMYVVHYVRIYVRRAYAYICIYVFVVYDCNADVFPVADTLCVH